MSSGHPVGMEGDTMSFYRHGGSRGIETDGFEKKRILRTLVLIRAEG